MAFINLTTLFGRVNTPQNINYTPVNFRGSENINTFNFGINEGYQDSFASNPISSNFKTKAEIEQIARSNPRIMAILKEHNLPLKVNMEALEDMR